MGSKTEKLGSTEGNEENEGVRLDTRRRPATQLLPLERVEKLIHLARGEKVLLDADLAKLYGVSTGNLNKAVRRNQSRFPPDFLFQLTDREASILIFQFGRSRRHGGRRHNPYAFRGCFEPKENICEQVLHFFC